MSHRSLSSFGEGVKKRLTPSFVRVTEPDGTMRYRHYSQDLIVYNPNAPSCIVNPYDSATSKKNLDKGLADLRKEIGKGLPYVSTCTSKGSFVTVNWDKRLFFHFDDTCDLFAIPEVPELFRFESLPENVKQNMFESGEFDDDIFDGSEFSWLREKRSKGWESLKRAVYAKAEETAGEFSKLCRQDKVLQLTTRGDSVFDEVKEKLDRVPWKFIETNYGTDRVLDVMSSELKKLSSWAGIIDEDKVADYLEFFRSTVQNWIDTVGEKLEKRVMKSYESMKTFPTFCKKMSRKVMTNYFLADGTKTDWHCSVW
jgi:hypothetical protein